MEQEKLAKHFYDQLQAMRLLAWRLGMSELYGVLQQCQQLVDPLQPKKDQQWGMLRKNTQTQQPIRPV
jgi:hypothetical protein